MVELFANSGDPEQRSCSVASDLGLHHLPSILLGVSRLQWVNLFSMTRVNSALMCTLQVLIRRSSHY